jgi:hypothetical protein
MFIRVYRRDERKEILVNTKHIWKIEVTYAIPNQSGAWTTTLEEGTENPNAVRIYDVFVGSEKITLFSEPGDPVVKVIEDIYNSAIKGPSAKQEGPNDGGS